MEVNLISEGRTFSSNLNEEFQDSENIEQQIQLFSSNDKIQETESSSKKSSVSRRGKRTRCSLALDWQRNWICGPRVRSSGRIDKYYYHKELNVTCRSLVEVEYFEKNKVLRRHATTNNKKHVELGDSSFTKNSGNASSLRKRTLHISDDNQALEEGTRRSELLKNRRIEYFEDFSEEDNISLPKGNYDEQGQPREIVEKFLADSFENLVQMHGSGPKTSKDQLQQNVEVEKMSTRDATKDGENGENANEGALQVQNLNHTLAQMNQQQDNLLARMMQLEKRVSNIEIALYELIEDLRKRFA